MKNILGIYIKAWRTQKKLRKLVSKGVIPLKDVNHYLIHNNGDVTYRPHIPMQRNSTVSVDKIQYKTRYGKIIGE